MLAHLGPRGRTVCGVSLPLGQLLPLLSQFRRLIARLFDAAVVDAMGQEAAHGSSLLRVLFPFLPER